MRYDGQNLVMARANRAPFGGVAGGESTRRYIIPTARTQLPKSLPQAITARSIARACCVVTTLSPLLALGLTGQKTFIYGIPEKIISWLAALLLVMGALRGQTVRRRFAHSLLRLNIEGRCDVAVAVSFGWEKLRVVHVCARGQSHAREG